MSIISAHKEYILEKVHKEFLLEGVVPTADQLEEALASYMLLHPNLSQPITYTGDYDIEHGGESSAALIQTIAQDFSDDISILSRELKSLITKGKSHYERWALELQRLTGKAKAIEYEIDSLLLLQGDTAGYFAHVGDVFSDTNQVDLEETTAKIDIREGTVTLNPDATFSDDASGGTRINLSYLKDEDVKFSVLTTSPTNYTNDGGSSLLNALTSQTDDGSCWLGTIISKSSGQVLSELKVCLSREEDTNISRIVYSFGTASVSGGTILCQWSLDGYQWYVVNSVQPLQSLNGDTVSWFFPLTSMRWVKFIITKDNYDESFGGTYYYKVGARSIRFYGNQYTLGEGSVLQSFSLQPLDAEGNGVVFSTAAIDVCEENAKDSETGEILTDIQYYLAGSQDDINWTDWIRVDPSSRENPVFPPIAVFGGAERIDNILSPELVSVFDSTKKPYEVTRTFEYDPSVEKYYLGYNFKDVNYSIVNTAIPLFSDTTTIDPNFIAASLEVWRNISTGIDLTVTVRGYPQGWGHPNDDEYTCFFYVSNSSGILLDFGGTVCEIDGVSRTGQVRVYRGVHSFKTMASNWAQPTSIDCATTEELIAADPLHPYNHKLIIEGYPYREDFSGTPIYLGTDIVAQYYCKRTTSFNLENNLGTDALDWYAFVKNVGTTEKQSSGILLKTDLSYSDSANEQCRLTWKTGEGSYKYLKIKCVFISNDLAYTPVLSSYRIKVGP